MKYRWVPKSWTYMLSAKNSRVGNASLALQPICLGAGTEYRYGNPKTENACTAASVTKRGPSKKLHAPNSN